MTFDPCNLCDSTEFVALRQQGWIDDILRDIVRCKSCGLLTLRPLPSEAQLESFYGADYFHCDRPLHGGYEDYEGDAENIKRSFRKRMRLVDEWKSVRVGNALDVGCATGLFLEVLREKGWHAQGLERSAYAAQKARDKGFQVNQNDIQSADLPREHFDLISLWDVIEHVQDPLGTLKRCREALAPGGFLLLSTPDASAPLARLLGAQWLGFRSAGEHLFFFGRNTLTQMLEKAGFELLYQGSVGKYMSLNRVIARLCYYTRIFRLFLPFEGRFSSKISAYFSSGDTMYLIARRLR